ncbi:hypothetical protein GDO78_002745 [Eleutherodactylus coqui]|uniref:Uncharacterized protein n=1 Tax=Eleutherodactylus coqui TaxID=57060 RepID=A0A8J6EZL7_ELECQ|nr:hypothetical protein GDO78_002745 [Eleutherodactylus coqui]
MVYFPPIFCLNIVLSILVSWQKLWAHKFLTMTICRIYIYLTTMEMTTLAIPKWKQMAGFVFLIGQSNRCRGLKYYVKLICLWGVQQAQWLPVGDII